jgi:hypothetical protein
MDYRPENLAFDIETLDGYATLLCCSDGSFLMHDDMTPLDLQEIIIWVYSKLDDNRVRHDAGVKFTKRMGWMFNLQFDFGGYLKKYAERELVNNEENLRAFLKSKKLSIPPFELFYIIGKGVSIKMGKNNAHIFDVSQFLETEGGAHTLDDLAGYFLSERKMEGLDRAKIGQSRQYWLDNLEDIKKYCVRDALLTKRLADVVVDAVGASFHIWSTYMFSNATIAKAWMEHYHPHVQGQFLRKIRGLKEQYVVRVPLPPNADAWGARLIYTTFYGGIFDVWKMGRIKNATELDFVSAYPFAISHMPDLDYLHPALVKPGQEPDTEAQFGYYQIRTKFDPKTMVLPFRQPRDPNRRVYVETIEPRLHFVAGPEMRFMMQNNIPFDMVQGIEYLGKRGYQAHDVMGGENDYRGLYDKRQEFKEKFKKHGKVADDVMQWMHKITLNATYGDLAQSRKGVVTEFTNFVYASFITSEVRARINKLIQIVGPENVIKLATDSITYVDKGQKVQEIKGLGGVEVKYRKAEIVNYLNGLYEVHQRGKEPILKKRGFPTLTIEQLAKAKGRTITVTRQKPVRFLTALRAADPKSAVREINVWRPETRQLNLAAIQNKRNVIDWNQIKFEYLREHAVDTLPIVAEDEAAERGWIEDNDGSFPEQQLLPLPKVDN